MVRGPVDRTADRAVSGGVGSGAACQCPAMASSVQRADAGALEVILIPRQTRLDSLGGRSDLPTIRLRSAASRMQELRFHSSEGENDVSSIGGCSLIVHCYCRAGAGCGRTGPSGRRHSRRGHWGGHWRGIGRRARGCSRRRRRRGHRRCHCCAGPTPAGRLPLLPAGLLSTAWRRMGRRCAAVLRSGGCGTGRGRPATTGSDSARRIR